MNFINIFINQYSNLKTQTAYKKDLEDLKDFLGNKKFPFKTSSSDLSAFKDTLVEQGCSTSTLNRKFSAIKAFYKWAVIEKHINFHPAEHVKLPKAYVENPTLALSDEEAKALLDLTSSDKDLLVNLQFALMLHLGVRRGELVNLKFEDVIHERGHTLMRVRGKGGKIRFIPINPALQQKLSSYRDKMEKIGKPFKNSDFIIQTSVKLRNQKAVNPSTIYRNIKRFCKKAGITVNITPHSCRATAISHLLDKKIPIRDVADYAGHSSINTTSIYDKKRQGYNNSPAYQISY